MSKVYYAHHIYKYGTQVEEYELSLIREYYPDAEIINPATAFEQQTAESEIMKGCFNLIRKSNVLVFSSMDGVIGKGVYDEVMLAHEIGLPVYYLHYHGLRLVKNMKALKPMGNPSSNRTYACVYYDELDIDTTYSVKMPVKSLFYREVK